MALLPSAAHESEGFSDEHFLSQEGTKKDTNALERAQACAQA
jgi:hypothetical protein